MGGDLTEKLEAYGESGTYPFHMPGHKRDRGFAEGFPNPYLIDITEIDGFDNLHHAEGILRDAMDRAAKVYGSDRTWFLVNGSTCGVEASILAAAYGGKLLVARNFHRSAGFAMILGRVMPFYVMPEYVPDPGVSGAVTAGAVRRALDADPDIRAVYMTSPTYEGIVSDIRAIAEAAHERGIPLIVDEAHGAHLPFGSFPAGALEMGADLVIQSLHKTLPSLTQTAVLHLRSNLIRPEDVERWLPYFESSSPSYVFLSAMDRCVRFMEREGWEKLAALGRRLRTFYGNMRDLRVLRVPERLAGGEAEYDRDLSKIVICGDGPAIARLLREEHRLEPEMYGENHVLCMATLMDSEEGLARLERAIRAIDERMAGEKAQSGAMPGGRAALEGMARELPDIRLMPWEACGRPAEEVPVAEAAGRISAGFVTVYPPGIPALCPGEMIPSGAASVISSAVSAGRTVDGLAGVRIRVLAEAADPQRNTGV